MAVDPKSFPKVILNLDHMGRGTLVVDGVMLHDVTDVKIDAGAGRITTITITRYASEVHFEGAADVQTEEKPRGDRQA